MLNIILAIIFFALGLLDVWGVGDVWTFWGWINLAIGAVLVIARAISDR